MFLVLNLSDTVSGFERQFIWGFRKIVYSLLPPTRLTNGKLKPAMAARQNSDLLQATASSEAMQGTTTEFGEMPPMKSAYQLETLPHEEMYMDARQIGIESSRRTNRSLNML